VIHGAEESNIWHSDGSSGDDEGILLGNEVPEPVPIVRRLRFNEVPFMHRLQTSDKPRAARRHSGHIGRPLFGAHPVKAPVAAIVRMEEDNIRFDAEGAQIGYTLLQMLKELGLNCA